MKLNIKLQLNVELGKVIVKENVLVEVVIYYVMVKNGWKLILVCLNTNVILVKMKMLLRLIKIILVLIDE